MIEMAVQIDTEAAELQIFRGEQSDQKYAATHQRGNQRQGQPTDPAHLKPALPDGCVQQ